MMRICLPQMLILGLAFPALAQVKVDERLPEYQTVSGISGTMKSAGSDTLNNLMALWAEKFKEKYPDVQIEIEGKGSSTAPPALIAGASSLGPMSRPMKDKEVDEYEKRFGYKPVAVKTSIDMVAVYVHKDNPVAKQGLSLQQVDAIFSDTRKGGHPSSIDTWGEAGATGPLADIPISLYGRNSASGTYGYFKKSALFKGDYKESVKEQPGSSSVVQGVASDKAGIAYSGIGYKTADVAAVPLAKDDGDQPVPASADSADDYPLARFLLVYVNKQPGKALDPLRAEFLRLIFSKEGQEIVVKDGYLPVSYELAKLTLADVGIDIDARPQAEVEVFYGTDRRPTGSKSPRNFYGHQRGDFKLGICRVSIPRDHRLGQLEGPMKLWIFEARPDPKKHVTLLSVTPLSSQTFWKGLSGAIQRAQEPSALVFINGFNTSFEDAARRTAQIAYDLGFQGAPIMYSWPSQGELSPAAYNRDQNHVDWASPNLANFLSDIKARSGAKSLHVIAHSMGNRYLTSALNMAMDTLRSEHEMPIINELALTAPDIDAQTFREVIAPRILDVAERTTLYACSKDVALQASKKYHGDYPRAGDSGSGIVVIEGMDTVDASAVDTTLLGHSYYAENRSVISDLFQLIQHGHAPGDRNLVPEGVGDLKYWKFRQ